MHGMRPDRHHDRRVLVTGIGPVSAIGVGREAFWRSLIEKKDGFGPITLCDTSRVASKVGAEVKNFNVADHVRSPLVTRLPRVVQFAFAAATLAHRDSGLDSTAIDPTRIGIIVGTSVGTTAHGFRMRDHYAALASVDPSTAFLSFYHSAACLISAELDLQGPVHTMTTGCNSGIDAAGIGLRLIQSGAADALLVVGSDCELESEFMAALCASDSLATKYNDRPHRASRPFDRGRDGNVLGEGAGALVLESEAHARARGARVYASLSGYASCGSGQRRRYSHASPDLDGRPAVRAMRSVLDEAGWSPSDVDLVNANGSSSVRYDLLEARALGEVLGSSLQSTPIHSIKSMLGQHGAGSSTLQAITASLSIDTGLIPPTINCEEPDPECGPLKLSSEPSQGRVERVLMNAIGMGGFYYSSAAFAAF